MKERFFPRYPLADYFSRPRRRAALVALLAFCLMMAAWWEAHRWYKGRLLADQRAQIMTELSPYGNALSRAIIRRLDLLRELKAFVETHASAPRFAAEFATFAAGLHAGTAGIRHFVAAPGGVLRYVYPLAGSEDVLGYDVLHDTRPQVRADVERAMRTRLLTLSGPFELLPGGLGFVGRLAVHVNDEFWGLVSVAVDLPALLEETGIQPHTAGLLLALRNEAGHPFFGNGAVFDDQPVLHRMDVAEGFWELAAVPRGGWDASIRKPLRLFDIEALAIASLLAALAYLLVHRDARLAQAVQARTREITKINQQLESDIGARKRVEEALRKSEEELETRVRKRTAELEEANKALRQSEAQLEAIVDNSTSVVFLKDTRGRYLLINREYEKLFHVTRDEIKGKADDQLFPPEIADRLRENDHKVLEAGRPLEFEEIVPQDDGLHTYIVNKFPAYDSQGIVYGICGVATDITERKLLEEDLKAGRVRAENWFQRLIETTQDAVVSIDRHGRVVLFNPAAERIFGYRKAEIAGQRVNLLMAEPYASEHNAYIARYERTGERRAIGQVRTVAARRKNGEVFPMELSVTEVRTVGEVRYAAFIRDISEKTRLQEQLIESERLAAIGTTASLFAHEVGNPLNGMSMTIQLLERRLARYADGTDERVTAAVERLKDEIRRLTNLLQDFRSLSRRENYIFKPTSLQALAGEVLAMEEESYRTHGIQIEQDFPPDLAPVAADGDKLKQALLNLCKNALEAMPEGGRITLRADNSRDRLHLEIIDTGIGIPAGVDIFKPFTTSKPSGTGLGLMIVRQVVAAHGGTISYSSEPGKGTVFCITLPLYPSSPEIL